MARHGRPVANKTVSPEQVAKNVEANVRKMSNIVHGQVYANKHGHTPAAILAALGAKAAHVTALLASADAVVATPVGAVVAPAVAPAATVAAVAPPAEAPVEAPAAVVAPATSGQ